MTFGAYDPRFPTMRTSVRADSHNANRCTWQTAQGRRRLCSETSPPKIFRIGAAAGRRILAAAAIFATPRARAGARATTTLLGPRSSEFFSKPVPAAAVS